MIARSNEMPTYDHNVLICIVRLLCGTMYYVNVRTECLRCEMYECLRCEMCGMCVYCLIVLFVVYVKLCSFGWILII